MYVQYCLIITQSSDTFLVFNTTHIFDINTHNLKF